jgi:hypothetical protein
MKAQSIRSLENLRKKTKDSRRCWKVLKMVVLVTVEPEATLIQRSER